MKIMLEMTDDEHGLTMAEIIKELDKYDITAERKSIYDDFEALRLLGLDIIKERDKRTFSYHVGNRKFELPELKLLVDAVQSSKFITVKKSRELIKKLESYASKYEASQLQRQVVVQGRIKAMNESIYYNIDNIQQAMNGNKKISFQYYQWNLEKKMEFRHDGDFYFVSPWELIWDNQNYYLLAFDQKDQIMKHYRVDKMLNIDLLKDKREGKEIYKEADIALYTKKHFGMYDGKEENVKILFENRLIGIVMDRFGKDVSIRKVDSNHFTVNLDIVVSGQFFGWILALGEGVKILSPTSVVDQFRENLTNVIEKYES